jgi:acetylornithine deacetylase/succinyl-diaminopimelate desuccinylase-like protein
MNSVIARIGEHAAAHLDDHIARIQGLIRQPSLSTSGGTGIREMAAHLQRTFADLGCRESAILETPGNPIVFGHYDVGAPKTLIVYVMYDTESVLPGEEWITPPFEGRLVHVAPFGRCIVGRGAINSKGPMQAFLNAVDSIKAVEGRPPVNLKFIAEGEEELGSMHLPVALKEHASRFSADALFFPLAGQQANGQVAMNLSAKGAVTFELEASGERWGRGPAGFEIHCGPRAVVDNPIDRLIESMRSLTTDNGNRVLVDGFHDDIAPPTAEEEELVDRLAARWDEQAFKARVGVRAFVDGLTGREALRRLIFGTAFVVRGVYGGDSRPGGVTDTKAIIAHRAVAKYSVSLQPNQHKAETVRKIRAHLDRHGFGDIEMRVVPNLDEPLPFGRVSLRDSIASAMLRTYQQLGVDPEIWPRSPGGWPGYLFQHFLGVPFISGGLGHGGRMHSPNEYLVVDGNGPVRGLVDLEKSYATVLYEFARS